MEASKDASKEVEQHVKIFRTSKSRLKKKLEDAQECEAAREIIVKMTDESKQMVK